MSFWQEKLPVFCHFLRDKNADTFIRVPAPQGTWASQGRFKGGGSSLCPDFVSGGFGELRTQQLCIKEQHSSRLESMSWWNCRKRRYNRCILWAPLGHRGRAELFTKKPQLNWLGMTPLYWVRLFLQGFCPGGQKSKGVHLKLSLTRGDWWKWWITLLLSILPLVQEFHIFLCLFFVLTAAWQEVLKVKCSM